MLWPVSSSNYRIVTETVENNDGNELVTITACYNGRIYRSKVSLLDSALRESDNNLTESQWISLSRFLLQGVYDRRDPSFSSIKSQRDSTTVAVELDGRILSVRIYKGRGAIKIPMGIVPLERTVEMVESEFNDLFVRALEEALRNKFDSNCNLTDVVGNLEKDNLVMAEQKQSAESELLSKFVLLLNERTNEIIRLRNLLNGTATEKLYRGELMQMAMNNKSQVDVSLPSLLETNAMSSQNATSMSQVSQPLPRDSQDAHLRSQAIQQTQSVSHPLASNATSTYMTDAELSRTKDLSDFSTPTVKLEYEVDDFPSGKHPLDLGNDSELNTETKDERESEAETTSGGETEDETADEDS